MSYFMGIDIGSGTSKAVITGDGELLAYHLLQSGMNYKAAAQQLVEELLFKAKLALADISGIMSTGNGSESLPFPAQAGADIPCSARGIISIFPAVRTVIDIGEQSTRVIRLNEMGRVTNFAVSEKCAAGSGRFLRIIANVLRIDLKDIGPLSLKSKNPISFTTGCAVFGESEAVSRVAEGATREDILAGVHLSLAGKVATLVDRIGLEKECAVCGGGGLDAGMLKRIEEKLGVKVLVPPQPQIITALGAAIMAAERSQK